MPFEKTNDGVVVTGDDTQKYAMMTQIKALEIEVKTGMTMSSRVFLLKYLRQAYGLQSRTKKDAIVEMKKLFNDRFGVEFYQV
jgi:hypothetical protein